LCWDTFRAGNPYEAEYGCPCHECETIGDGEGERLLAKLKTENFSCPAGGRGLVGGV
jgi:hypothetical protein